MPLLHWWRFQVYWWHICLQVFHSMPCFCFVKLRLGEFCLPALKKKTMSIVLEIKLDLLKIKKNESDFWGKRRLYMPAKRVLPLFTLILMLSLKYMIFSSFFEVYSSAASRFNLLNLPLKRITGHVDSVKLWAKLVLESIYILASLLVNETILSTMQNCITSKYF